MVEATSTRQQGMRGEPLKKRLKMRHMAMISLGGIIGIVRGVGG